MLYFHCLTPGWPVGISEVVSPFETEEQWTSVYCCHCNFEILFSALAAKCLCSFQTKSSKSCLHFLLNAHMSPVIAKIPSINVILTFKWNFQNIVSFSSISDSFRNVKGSVLRQDILTQSNPARRSPKTRIPKPWRSLISSYTRYPFIWRGRRYRWLDLPSQCKASFPQDRIVSGCPR